MSSLLAQHLERTRGIRARTARTIPVRPPDSCVEASEAQQQVWLHAQLAGDIPLYNEPVTIHYKGNLDVAAFERSFNAVLGRHEAWRTFFEWRNGKFLQIVVPSLEVSIPFTDLRQEPAHRRERRALELATQDGIVPIDITRAPLFRARLVRLGDSEFRFYLTLHHMLFDGVSLYQIFLPELQANYRAFLQGTTAALEPLTAQYADWCLYQKQHSDDTVIASRLKYWEELLRGDLPEIPLPLDRPRPPVRSFAGAHHPFSIPAETARKLKRIGEANRATAYMTLLAAFHVLLFQLTGQADQVIGSVTSTRAHPQTERLLGYFLNTILVRTRLEPSARFVDSLAHVREVTLEALDHEVPFSTLVSRFGKRRKPGTSPLFQVMFSMEPELPELDRCWGLTQMDVETNASKFDLYLELDDRPDALIGRFTYSTEVFDQATINQMSRQWAFLLDAIANNPDQTVLQLSQLPKQAETAAPLRKLWHKIVKSAKTQ